MSEQENSRSLERNHNIIREKEVKESARSGHDVEDTQWSPSLSSPDSGMGNTIFSSPEKSDKESNDSLDSKFRDSMNKSLSPLKNKLNRNNVYGAEGPASSHSPKDPPKLNHSFGDAKNASERQNTLVGQKKLTLNLIPKQNNSKTLTFDGAQSEDKKSTTSTNSNCARDLFRNQFTQSDVRLADSGSLSDTLGLGNNSETIKSNQNSGETSSENTYNIKPTGSGSQSEIHLTSDRHITDVSKENESAVTCKGNSENTGKSNNETVAKDGNSNLSKVETSQGVTALPVASSIAQVISDKLLKGNQFNEVTKKAAVAESHATTGCDNFKAGDIVVTHSESNGEGSSQIATAKSSPFVEINVQKGSSSKEKLLVEGGHSESENVLCNSNEKSKTKGILGVDVDVGIDLEALRDTDSEGGESCCSEDQDACEGENGCIHQDGVCDTEQNWDYLMDEEFNVPKKPILNGTAEHLERRSSLKRKATEESEDSSPPKCKRGIQFEGVTVFYFPRSQGFTCVPSQGGSTLGMSRRHAYIRQFSLAEHAVEQRRAHREYLLRLRQQRSARERGDSSSRGSSSEDSEENSEEASDLSDSELDADSYYFLQPLPIRQRRALLRQAGICHIEGLEKEECKDIRVSRELCGCQCKVYCDPDTCQCAEAGIRCQVDRHNFPCGCSREGCGNTYGRIEFNPIRVRTHFIHTLMRLEIEKRQQQQQQQQQQWQNQQRAKWLATTSTPANGFNSGSGVTPANLPFFEGSGREATSQAVTDLQKFSSTVEMASCVGSMNTALYPHFESRQMLGPAATTASYVQQDNVGDFNSGTCSVFGGLGATFDPSSPYGGACHSFPSSSVVPSQVVAPQVAHPQPSPEPYNSLSKFANTANLVSTTFPYSGAIVPVNCSNTHNNNNFCVPAMHENSTTTTVFGHYHEPSAVAHNLFKASMNECGEFQPNFEAISSSSASSEKTTSIMPASSLMEPSKEVCNEYTTEASGSGCSSAGESGYKIDLIPPSNIQDSSADSEESDRFLPAISVDPHASSLSVDASHLTSSKKGLNNQVAESADAGENLGEIVKKSIVETVSA